MYIEREVYIYIYIYDMISGRAEDREVLPDAGGAEEDRHHRARGRRHGGCISLSLSIYIYIYIHIEHTYIYIYTYIHTKYCVYMYMYI